MRTEAFAYHWWRRYWEAETNDEAYAAWELFMRCVDRRGYQWMLERHSKTDAAAPHHQKRAAHLEFNINDVKSAMEKQEKDLDGHFLGRDIINGIGPWV
jgi:hypothetical protein